MNQIIYIIALLAIAILYGYTKLRLHFLAKKFGTKPALNTLHDGFFGFKIAYQLSAAAKHGRLLRLLESRLQSKGPTYQFMLAGTTLYHTKDPENIKALLATNFNDFGLGLRNRQFKPFLGEGIFTLDKESWKHSRLMLRPQFLKERYSDMESLEVHLQHLVNHIKSNKGERFEFQELIMRFTLDYSTEFLFGQSVESLNDGTISYSAKNTEEPVLKKSFIGAFDFCQKYTMLRILRLKLYYTLNSPEYQENCVQVKKFAETYVKKALALSETDLEKRSNEEYTFLYELVQKTRDPIVIRDQLLNILLAGRDTTAGALAFAILEMSRDPKVVLKLREEIGSRYGLGDEADISLMTFETLKRCEYLQAFIKELLRVYPVVPNNARVAVTDTFLPRGGGPEGKDPVFVKKGNNVMYTVYAMHRDEANYGSDAKIFRPERWLEPEMGIHAWDYLPFNGGPRVCLGQQFALTEISYVVARLVQIFDTFDGEVDEVVCNSFLTISVRGGVNVVIK